MRYATEDAFFCIQEINIGMTADVGTLQRLPKLIPEGVAQEWAYTGDRIPAARAQEVGLVNEVYTDHESMVAGVLEIAGRIAVQEPARAVGHQGVDQLHPRPLDGRQPRVHRPVADRHVPGRRHDGGASVARSEKRDPAYDDLLPVQKPI